MYEVLDETFDIAEALLALDAPGTFALRLHVPADALQLSLRKVGPIEFPISPESVSRMLDLATRSHFGWGEHTITDPAVRSGWELRKSRIKIDGRRWNPVLREQLVEIREQLGLPDAGQLRATLDKLTIYGRGEFFAPHQDTEKDDEMIATLVVLLPSSFSGGALRCARNDERMEFRRTKRGAEQLELIAFYSDCHHEIRPVKTGHRLALVYRLGFEPGAEAAESEVREAPGLARLEQVLAEHFERGFEKLAVLLDHQYTPRNLAWGRLKQGDRQRAEALREVASALGFDLHLALADIYEAWQCSPSMSSYRRSKWSSRRHQDDDGGRDGDYTLEEMYDSSVTLRHWRTLAGACSGYDDLPVGKDELCFTTAHDALEPVKSDYEGYMGNYGDTLERWYHRAAVVLWPKANAFLVEARLDPGAALRELILQRQRSEDAEMLGPLLEIWPQCVGPEPDAVLVVEALGLAALIEDTKRAATLLAPLKPAQMDASAIEVLLQAARRHGASWCETVWSSWHGEPRGCGGPRWYTRVKAWHQTFPQAWLSELIEADAKLGSRLARFIIAQQWAELREQRVTPVNERSPYVEYHKDAELESFAALLGASALAGARELHDEIVAQLCAEPPRLSALELAAVSLAAHAQIDAKRWSAWGSARLLRHARRALQRSLVTPERGREDWEIVVAQSCSCRDCESLHEFLRSPEIGATMPLAKARRQHIHQIIDRARLPVSHVTERKGRPFRLVLTKRAALFELDAQRRARQVEALQKLEALGE